MSYVGLVRRYVYVPMRVPSGVFGLGKTSLSSSSVSRDDDILSRWNTPAKDSPFFKVNVPRPSLSPLTHSPLYTAPLKKRDTIK